MTKAKTESETFPPEDEPEATVEAAPPAERLYLRSKADGHLFAFTEELATRPDLEVVGESDAYPERHLPDHVKEAAASGEGVDLAGGITAENVPEKDPPTDPALAKQAAKGWPK